ncbi:adhesive plaque matrix protein isoform X2 [Hyalella azteca]|uniref:Adhesive plaque matrix protein isoform X2 n=1 Tax=Hyalella azteca TaxID=294128 RepID=A0A8B7PB29_HYAAZ|nr:adhesive plaque matrix protein isoform X2 [Hyalella azteca]
MYWSMHGSLLPVIVVALCLPLVPSHKPKKHGDSYTDHRGITVYEAPSFYHDPPSTPYHSTYGQPPGYAPVSYPPVSYAQPAYEYAAPYPEPYGVTYLPVPTRERGKKSNKSLIKSLKQEELQLYKGFKSLSKSIWKGYKGDEDELLTVHRPVYNPPPPPRLVEVRVPKCKDTVEIPTYITETLIKTRNIYVTKTRTKTTERHIKEYVVNTQYQTQTATKVVSHYAPASTITIYSPPETVYNTIYSPPETVYHTQYITQLHEKTQFLPHYVTTAHSIYITKTSTTTTESFVKEYVVNTRYKTRTTTKVVTRYAPASTITIYSPPETVYNTIYSPPETVYHTQYITQQHEKSQYVQPETVYHTQYITQLHEKTQFLPHYVTVTIAPNPTHTPHLEYSEHATPHQASEHHEPSSYSDEKNFSYMQKGDGGYK